MKEKLFKLLMRYKYLLIVITAGITLILWPESSPVNLQSSNKSSGDYEPFPVEEFEKRLSETLSGIDGVGRAEVILTLRSDTQILFKEDINIQNRGEDMQTQSKTVLFNDGSGQKPAVVNKLYPIFEGALIICDGGGDPNIKLLISQAVASVTGLGQDKISINKMKANREEK